MSEIAYRFCKHAPIVAVVTLVAGIAVALDAMGAAHGCPPLATIVETCASPLPVPPLVTPAADLGTAAAMPFRQG